MSDIRCGAWLNDDFDRASRYDAERAWRLVIAFLSDDDTAKEQIEQELGDCPRCLRAVGSYLAGVVAGTWIGYGRDNALAVAQDSLRQVLSASDLLNPPPE